MGKQVFVQKIVDGKPKGREQNCKSTRMRLFMIFLRKQLVFSTSLKIAGLLSSLIIKYWKKIRNRESKSQVIMVFQDLLSGGAAEMILTLVRREPVKLTSSIVSNVIEHARLVAVYIFNTRCIQFI